MKRFAPFLPPRSRFGLYFADQALNKFVPSATETVAFRHECLMLNGCRGFHNRIIACKCTQLNVATLPLKLQQNDGEKGVYISFAGFCTLFQIQLQNKQLKA